MKVILDSTAVIHLNNNYNKMLDILGNLNITETYITRINYLELLSGASVKSKIALRKTLHKFNVLEFTEACKTKANTLAMQHTVSKENQKDFLIASIAISNNLPLLTENDKHFQFKGLKLLPYRIKTGWF
ncbi:MAG: type II toxin-antitoxin system VapC family toxin [Bacteroidetes bacterium]|nr:type II toxin-antitoxin system VapC family toxin [Bacteroidota bacterium]